MSASSSNPGERELDALRRAQRSHEPSMEEILASIRSIIADDRENARLRQAAAQRSGAGPQIVYSKPAANESEPPRGEAPEPAAPRVVWIQPEPAAEPAPKPGQEAAPPSAFASRAVEPAPLAGGGETVAGAPDPPALEAVAQPAAEAASVTEQPVTAAPAEPRIAAQAEEPEPLVAPETQAAVASSFEALTAALAQRSAEVADEMKIGRAS